MSLTINAKLAQVSGTPSTGTGIFTTALNSNYNGYDCSWNGNLESFEIEYSVLDFYIDYNGGFTTSLNADREQWITFNKNDTEEKRLYRDDWNRLEMIAYCSSWTSNSVQLNFIAKIDEEGYWSPDLLTIENPEKFKTLSRFGASLDDDLKIISNNIDAHESSLQCTDIQCENIEANLIRCDNIVCDSITCDNVKTSFGAYYKIDFNNVDANFTSQKGSIISSSGKTMSFNKGDALSSNEITVDTGIYNLEKFFNTSVLKKNMYSTGFGCKIKCWNPKSSSENTYDKSSSKTKVKNITKILFINSLMKFLFVIFYHTIIAITSG